jgi:hypothetical protein
MARRNSRRFRKFIMVAAFTLLSAILFLNAYTVVELPEESYTMSVSFWNHGELVSLRNASKDFDGILLCTAQKVNLQAKCVIFEDRVNLLKQNGKVVEIIFDRPINITIRQWIRPEERNHIPTDANGYRILTSIEKIVFVLEGDLEGYILTKSANEMGYGCWAIWKDGKIDKSWIEEIETTATQNSV